MRCIPLFAVLLLLVATLRAQTVPLVHADVLSAGDSAVATTNDSGSTIANAEVGGLYPNRWQRVAEPLGVSSKRTPLIFSEIMPHPPTRSDGRNLEFIEIYNTNPWPEDLTRWRISGDVDFAFPSGTSIPAQGFLVIAAVPADVQAVTGATGVLGPWVGALSNEGGMLRLRRANDAIVLEALWDDSPEWPAPADGAGHSLVLARPSFGEGDVRAWSASATVGGSPGAIDAVPASAQDHVLINEILAHSTTGGGFIELFNSSTETVDLSGCWLSDDPAVLGMFEIPAGTILAPRGFVSFATAQLGFALSPDGETAYLSSAARTRVLDAVRFRGQFADSAIGRVPDGEGALCRVVTATPGTLNTAAARGPVIVNELYFNPITGDGEEEWLELHNLSNSAVSLGGWSLTEGVSFTFPSSASIPANGYVVVAKSPSRVFANHPGLAAEVVYGPFSGSLSDSGENIVLSQPVTLTGRVPYFASIDEVTYADKSRWSQWADGGGSTLELADPRGSATPLWLDSDETSKAPWTLVQTTGLLDHMNTNANVIADRLDAMLMNAGEALMDDVEATPAGGANRVINGGLESGLSPWLVQGTLNRSILENTGFAGSKSLRLVATGRGDTSPNHVRVPLSAAISANSTATIRAQVRWLRGSPEFLLRLKGGGLEAYGALTVPRNLGTPGAINSRATANAAPAIGDVLHRPSLPVAGMPFQVFARVSDPDGVGSVLVKYRLDPSTTTTSVAMVDDGTGGDLLAGDGIFTGTIPAQSAGRLVGFTIIASDNAAASAVFPPQGECLARVGETLPAGAFGAYSMWITNATLSAWTSRLSKSNEPFPITLLHNGTRIFYGTGAHFAAFSEGSNNNPTTAITGYEIDLPPGEPLFGEDDVTLDWPVRDVTNQREQLMHWMLEQMNLPTLHRRDVHLVVNGLRRTSANVAIYHEAHQPGGSHLESHFPDDPDGRLIKTSRWDEFTDTGGVQAGPLNSLLPFTTTGGAYKTARYRWSWRPRASRGNENDFSDFFRLVSAANTTGPGYVGAVNAVVDMDQWMRNFAFADLCAYWDTFGNPNGKNAYLYKPTMDGWKIITNDLDVGIGADINTASPPSSAPLFPANVDSPVQRMYNTPAFIRDYWRALQEATGSFFRGSAVTTRVAQRYNGYIASGVAVTSPLVGSGPHNLSIPAWIDQRVTFIQSQLGTVSGTFSVNGPTSFNTASSPITVSGTAPVGVKTITFNGLERPITWTSVTAWSASVNVTPGTNPLVIQAYDGFDAEVASRTLTVTFTGTAAWAALRINEWLADNAGLVQDPVDGDSDDWLELYNPTAAAVDLAGWTISDSSSSPTTFAIPGGYSIPAGGRLLVWADAETDQNTGTGALHTSFKLSASGETLTLRAPDGTVVDTVTFGTQVGNISQGRIPDGSETIEFLAAATAGNANTAALARPTATASLTEGNVVFTITTTPGFIYQPQYKDDLTDLDWTNLGPSITASGSTISITDTPGAQTQRFYRAVRTP